MDLVRVMSNGDVEETRSLRSVGRQRLKKGVEVMLKLGAGNGPVRCTHSEEMIIWSNRGGHGED